MRRGTMKETLVVSGFPGIGKSYLYKLNEKMIILDSDSSEFSWIEEGVRHPDFPNNYMEHIKSNIGKVDNIFVSSHDIVRRELEANGINYLLVYPSIDLKDEYIQRYKDRGSNEGFINFIRSNWKEFITAIEKETFPELIRLYSGEYLRDALEKYYRHS
jgi:hypothetical protein